MECEKINKTQSGRGYLFRVSASDICNYDCQFCHPSTNESVTKLTDEEFLKVFKAMSGLYKLKTLHFTGGEPLMRKTLPEVIRQCRMIAGDELDIAMTTNASLLEAKLDELVKAGLSRANISFHSIDDEKYQQFTGSKTKVKDIKRTIHKAKEAGLGIKVNSVVIRNFNDMDIPKMAEFCFSEGIIPRFLELGIYGPVAQWYTEKDQVPHKEILEIMEKNFGKFERDMTYRGNGPSKYYKNDKGQVFGILDNQSYVSSKCRQFFYLFSNPIMSIISTLFIF